MGNGRCDYIEDGRCKQVSKGSGFRSGLRFRTKGLGTFALICPSCLAPPQNKEVDFTIDDKILAAVAH